MNLSKYKGLGVINRTPNSFSDRGKSLNPDFFKSQLQDFLNDPGIIIDVGFESTAPMNEAISEGEEMERFLSFLHISKDFSFSHRFISFDTYKIENFLMMTKKFSEHHPKASFIFNDVSGVLDEELKKALLKFKGKNFYYIYTFSHIPERSQALLHMNFINEKEDIIEQTKDAFIKAYEWFKSFQMEDQLILDPGFGFSKPYEQNWRLINSYSLLEKNLRATHPHIKNAVLIGLSKKSFLKKALTPEKAESELEILHSKCISLIRAQASGILLFRVHDPKIL